MGRSLAAGLINRWPLSSIRMRPRPASDSPENVPYRLRKACSSRSSQQKSIPGTTLERLLRREGSLIQAEEWDAIVVARVKLALLYLRVCREQSNAWH